MLLQQAIQKIKTEEGTLSIDLSRNNLRDEEAKDISNGIKYTKLSQLTIYLHQNEIGNIGAEYIGDGIKYTNLSLITIYLNKNKIEDEGVFAIIKAIRKASVRVEIYFSGNSIKHETTKELRSVLNLNKKDSYRNKQKFTYQKEKSDSVITTIGDMKDHHNSNSIANNDEENINQLKKIKKLEEDNQDTKEQDIELIRLKNYSTETKFESKECVKIFQISNLEICTRSNKVVVPIENLNHCSVENHCILFWTITISKCINASDYLKICKNEFQKEGYKICDKDTSVKFNENISKLQFNTVVTTVLHSDECIKIFQNHNIEMCSNNEKIVLPEKLNDCENCVSKSSWKINIDYCKPDNDYFGICLDEFQKRNYIICNFQHTTEASINIELIEESVGGNTWLSSVWSWRDWFFVGSSVSIVVASLWFIAYYKCYNRHLQIEEQVLEQLGEQVVEQMAGQIADEMTSIMEVTSSAICPEVTQVGAIENWKSNVARVTAF